MKSCLWTDCAFVSISNCTLCHKQQNNKYYATKDTQKILNFKNAGQYFLIYMDGNSFIGLINILWFQRWQFFDFVPNTWQKSMHYKKQNMLPTLLYTYTFRKHTILIICLCNFEQITNIFLYFTDD